jgi:hypothetical protein
MILRRVIKHFRNQEWTAIFLDFLIVVVGVFVGLQVQQWSDARQDRRDEVVFLRALHEDVIRAEALMNNGVTALQDNARNLSRVTDVIFGAAPARELTPEDCNAIAYSNVLYVGRSDLPALVRLRDAGRTGIIRDDILADALAALTQRRNALEVISAQASPLLIHIVRDFAEVFPMVSVSKAAPNPSNGLDRDVLTHCNLEDIRANQALLNAIAFNADAFDAFMRSGLAPWAVQFKTVHQRLDELLDIDHNTSGTSP